MFNLKLSGAEQPPMKQASVFRLDQSSIPLRMPEPALAAAAWPRVRAGAKSRVLLLQGPVGPFFRRLQQRLAAAGFDARRVCFNAGDRLFAGDERTTIFSGALEAWPGRFAELLRETGPDLIVLFGAERPLHAAARRVAREAGVRVLCLEEGYLRPGWITAELDGNNAASPVAGRVPAPDWIEGSERGGTRTPRRGFRQACLYATAYYGAQAVGNTASERGLLHRSVRASEGFYFARNLVRKVAYAARDALAIRRLTRGEAGRYVVVAFQTPGDSQLGAAACGWTNERLAEEALAALASVPGGAVDRLVFKIHPLDRGHTRLARVVRARARRLGVADRVDVLHCGAAGPVIRHSVGLLTINSTAGFSAIFHGVPLVAVGRALYAHPALSRSGGREAVEALFRGEARPPAPELSQSYLAWIRERCLLGGDFYSGRGSAEACDNLAEKVAELCFPSFGRHDENLT